MTSQQDKLYNAMRDANALARFLNLPRGPGGADSIGQPRPKEVEDFRRECPSFAPEAWWGSLLPVQVIYRLADKSTPYRWQYVQDRLGAYWGSFTQAQVLFLQTQVFDVPPPEVNVLVPGDPRQGGANVLVPGNPGLWGPKEFPIFEDFASMGEYSFHRGLLFLQQQPWRARRCQSCGKFIVVWHKITHGCNDAENCGKRRLERNESRLESWRKHHKRWPSQSPQARRKARLKRLAKAKRNAPVNGKIGTHP